MSDIVKAPPVAKMFSTGSPSNAALPTPPLEGVPMAAAPPIRENGKQQETQWQKSKPNKQKMRVEKTTEATQEELAHFAEIKLALPDGWSQCPKQLSRGIYDLNVMCCKTPIHAKQFKYLNGSDPNYKEHCFTNEDLIVLLTQSKRMVGLWIDLCNGIFHEGSEQVLGKKTRNSGRLKKKKIHIRMLQRMKGREKKRQVY
ncbi:hypothetical protein RFI_17465, partial [Reticulomyxa filosa]